MGKLFGTAMLGESSPQHPPPLPDELGSRATARCHKLYPSMIGTLECLLTLWGINEWTIGEIRLECPMTLSGHAP